MEFLNPAADRQMEVNAKRLDAMENILDRILNEKKSVTAKNVLWLAEAYAWLDSPNQPHGSGAPESSS